MKSNEFTSNAIEAAIRLGLLFMLAIWCFEIIKPFVVPVVWGLIIAVAIYPLFIKLKSALGGRNKLASIVYTVIALAILITPSVMISNSIIDTSAAITERYQQGALEIPPANENVKEWPLVGEKLYNAWSLASKDLEKSIKTYEPQLKKVGEAIVGIAAGVGGGVLQFVLSIIISGVFLANTSGAYEVTIKIFSRLTTNEQGKAYADLSKLTIRSVAQGVLGVAMIQAVLSALGMIVMDVPGWGLWTFFVLVAAIAQLPPILVLSFVSAYVFSVAESTPAVIFLIYCLLISASDGFLKPLFLGRGMDTPMLVILLGAIGGMMLSGIIGLFVGAIILALGYELFMAWLNDEKVVVEEG